MNDNGILHCSVFLLSVSDLTCRMPLLLVGEHNLYNADDHTERRASEVKIHPQYSEYDLIYTDVYHRV